MSIKRLEVVKETHRVGRGANVFDVARIEGKLDQIMEKLDRAIELLERLVEEDDHTKHS